MAEPIRWQDAWWQQQPDGSWLRFNEQTQSWEPHVAVAQPTGMSAGAKAAIIAVIAVGMILVLAILAAIAIPVFLRQREKGWTSQVESALQNAATAEESYYTSGSRYTTSVQDLEFEGLRKAIRVEIFVVQADESTYCIEARHLDLPNEIWSYDSEFGRVEEGPCL
jgi:type IV pilus assembly protein PilA